MEWKYLKYQTWHYLNKNEISKFESSNDYDEDGHKLLNGHIILTDKNNKLYYEDKPLHRFMIKNADKIKLVTSLGKYSNFYEVKVAKTIEEYANNNLFGVTILDMSKRIMNEVMTLAEYEGIKIFYQDTDSMHIEKDRLNDLVKAYKLKYGRDLIGADMGQFHSDFDELTGDVYATKSIFLGKKAYIDILENDKGEHSVHYRMKGIPLKCIKYHALLHYTKLSLEEFKSLSKTDRMNILIDALWKLYLDLYNNKTIEFDLKLTQERFKRNAARKIETVGKFTRNISFKKNGFGKI